MMPDFDYEIVMGMITIVTPSKEPEEYPDDKKTYPLPTEVGINYYQGYGEICDALRAAKIQNRCCHFEKICCSEARLLFGGYDESVKRYLDVLIHCKEDFQAKSHILYCPFCGKRLKFVRKNLASFKLGREKREVCGYKFEKVS